MTPNITTSTRFHARCEECHWTSSSTSQFSLNDEIDVHRHKHAAWEATGSTLVGKVYDSRAKDAPWYGIVYDAETAARESGYSFLAWNGLVYPVGNFGENAWICRAADVPGLEKYG